MTTNNPVEPSEAMIEAAQKVMGIGGDPELLKRIYLAMQSAAAPVGDEVREVIEAAAKAISRYRYKPGYQWERMFETEREFIRGEARVALEAADLLSRLGALKGDG